MSEISELRIAVVTPELHRRGGTERGTAEVVSRLAREHRICLFAHRWEPDGTPNICFHRVPVLKWPGLLRFFSFYVMASRLVRGAARAHGGFDAVYSPGPNCRQVQVVSAWFCQARQRELLASGKFRLPPASLPNRLRLLHRRIYAAAVTRLEQSFYRGETLQHVISCADVLKRDLMECYGLPSEKIIVSHSGVDTRGFSPELRRTVRENARRELGLGDDFCFAFIGTDWVRKCALTVLQALESVKGARLLAVGPDDPAAYARFAKQIGIADRVRFLPPRPDIIYYLAAADALVSPSIFEPFGLIPLEAMACGVPVIISPHMGVAEIAGPDDCLMVQRVDDPRELANAMQRLMDDAALRERLITNGLRLAQRRSWDRNHSVIAQALLQAARGNSNVRAASALAAAR